MTFLKSRKGAWIVCAAVILFSVLFGSHRSLSSEMEKISAGFTNGVYDEASEYMRPSITEQLSERCACALNLETVGSKYYEAASETAALRSARNQLLDLLSAGAGPSALYEADLQMDIAFSDLYTSLSGGDIAAEDSTRIVDDLDRMTSAAYVIEKSGYNESVLEFRNSVLSKFPTNLLKFLSAGSIPELFA